MPAEEVTQREYDIRIAKLGIEIENFKHSSLGHYLEDRANVEIEQATAKLIVADPEDAKTNRELRNDIAVAKNYLTWLEEALNSGRQMLVKIENEEAEEES
jgi:predicted RNA-binding protein Jag